MMENLNSLAALQTEWQDVIRMRERMDQLVISMFASDPITSPVFGNILYNLPFLLAIEVLKQALLQLGKVGQWMDPGYPLGDLMDRAKTSVAWIDWQRLRENAEHGNELARHGRLFGDEQCLQGIAAIEAQLLAWGVIPAAKPAGGR
jgi:hypothetical protein